MNAYTIRDRRETFVPRFHCKKITLQVIFHRPNTLNSLDEIINEIKESECAERERYTYKIGLVVHNNVSLLSLHMPFKDYQIYNGLFVNVALERLNQSNKKILKTDELISLQFTILKKPL